jgi:hypothetical protein
MVAAAMNGVTPWRLVAGFSAMLALALVSLAVGQTPEGMHFWSSNTQPIIMTTRVNFYEEF